MQIFFVETADFVDISNVTTVLERIKLNRNDIQLIEFIKYIIGDNQIDLSNYETKIVLDSRGNLIPNTTILGQAMQASAEEELPVFVGSLSDFLCFRQQL
jgi:hypothetical protein